MSKNLSVRAFGALMAVLLLSGSSLARASSQVSLRGFATLGYGVLLSDDKEMRRFMNLDRQGSVQRDTRVGLNLGFKMDEQWSFSGQIMARGIDFYGQAPADHELVFDWYFLRYRALPAVEVRAGRQPLPFSLIAETQDVGYVNPWIRAPLEVYAMVPVKSVTGAQARYMHALADGEITLGVYSGQDGAHYGFQQELATGSAGAPTVQVTDEARAQFSKLAGGFVNLSYRDLTAMLAYLQLHSEITANFFADTPTGQPFPATVRSTIPFTSTQDYKSESLGLRWEPESLLLQSEARRVRFTTDLSDLHGDWRAYYVSLGVRYAQLMPVLTYADWQQRAAMTSMSFNPVLGVPMPSSRDVNKHQTTRLVGLNWHLNHQVLWKFEYQVTENRSNSEWGLIAQTLYPGKTAKVFSTAIESTF